jgi:membrane protein
MTKKIENKLAKIPIVNRLVKPIKKIKILGLHGLSLYDVIEIYLIGIVKGAFTARASSISFSFFMALFPFMLFILTLIPFVPIDGFQENFLMAIQKLIPPSTGESVTGVIKDIINNRYSGLLSFGFIASIFLMTNGVNAIFSGFEYSYHIQKMRSVIRQYFMSMGIAIVLSIVLITVVAINIYFVLGVNDLKAHGWINDISFVLQLGSGIFFVLLIFVSVSFLYKYGTVENKRASYIPGAILTTLLAIIMFKLFAIYVLKFSTYNKLYGSIGTLLILMLYVWINSMNLLPQTLRLLIEVGHYMVKK